jgi:hypothetical protein
MSSHHRSPGVSPGVAADRGEERWARATDGVAAVVLTEPAPARPDGPAHRAEPLRRLVAVPGGRLCLAKGEGVHGGLLGFRPAPFPTPLIVVAESAGGDRADRSDGRGDRPARVWLCHAGVRFPALRGGAACPTAPSPGSRATVTARSTSSGSSSRTPRGAPRGRHHGVAGGVQLPGAAHRQPWAPDLRRSAQDQRKASDVSRGRPVAVPIR